MLFMLFWLLEGATHSAFMLARSLHSDVQLIWVEATLELPWNHLLANFPCTQKASNNVNVCPMAIPCDVCPWIVYVN